MRDFSAALAVHAPVGVDGLGQDDGLQALIQRHGGRLGTSCRRHRHRPALFQCGCHFELAYDDAGNAMVLSQAAELAISPVVSSGGVRSHGEDRLGTVAVQVVWSSRRGSREIEHLEPAHDDAELEALKAGQPAGGGRAGGA
jgi:hypothetical protein